MGEKDDYFRELGQRLRAARGTRSQSQIIDALDRQLAQNSLSNYEAGRRGIDAYTLAQLARACGVSPLWLLTGEGEMRPEGIEEGRAIHKRLGDIRDASSRVGACLANTGLRVPGGAVVLLVELVYRYGLSDEDVERLARELHEGQSDE